MADFHSILLYCSLFISLFFEVFILVTYFEVRQEIEDEKRLLAKGPTHFPSVTVIVPAFNEEKTVGATIKSLLRLDYPKNKLQLILVDDGSTDETLQVFNKFKNHPQVKIISKENGGKHTAVNAGLAMVETELMSCLDADSFVTPETLRNMVPFFDNAEVKAVVPSIKVHEPKNMLQEMQKNEYRWGIFLRRMLSSLGALYVTPGPLSVIRTEVLRELGGYRLAHQTEDMEMALRLHSRHYKIVNATNAFVYTVTPHRIRGLIKQRTRWTYGFLKNTYDYRELMFNTKYGNIGIFILPIAIFSIVSVPFMTSNLIWKFGNNVFTSVHRIQIVGFHPNFSWPSFDWYFLNTGVMPFLTLGTFLMTFTILYLSMKMADGKARVDKGLLSYLAFYAFISPLWLLNALYKTVFRRKITWR